MRYRILDLVVDYLPNVIDLISNPTIQGAVVGEDGKLSIYTFVSDSGEAGELVVFHRNWRGTISIDGQVAVGDWDDPASTLLIDANGGTCQVVGDQLQTELGVSVA
ncbi:hypothetical protein KBI23_25615 [bacterium]|nr:hypothetical protein [bacterium]MBP9811532.1 hypothetical protein [bacterium]